MQTRPVASHPSSDQAGFTLVEVLIAIVVLVFGLIAVTNLLVVAAASNQVANHMTAASTEASEVLERLKAIPFTTLTAGGSVTSSSGSIANCAEPASNCVVAGNFNAQRLVPGVGTIQVLWEIEEVEPAVLFIRVRAESLGALAQRRSRSEFTVFRSCTATSLGCP